MKVRSWGRWLGVLGVLVVGVTCQSSSTPVGPDVSAVPPTMPASYVAQFSSVAEGVGYWHFTDSTAAQQWHVVVADLTKDHLDLEAETSNDSLFGFETTSAMTARLASAGEGEPLVAINADFWHREGQPVGMFVDDGAIWRGPWRGTGDRAGKTRAILAFNAANDLAMGLPDYALTLTLPDETALALDAINLAEDDSVAVVYTDAYPEAPTVLQGFALVGFSTNVSSWLPNQPLALTYQGRLEEPQAPQAGEVIVALPADQAARLDQQTGMAYTLSATLGNLAGEVESVLGAIPRLIDNVEGSPAANPVRFAEEEGIFPAFVTDRHPRSAIGYDADRDWLYLVVVDGRQQTAQGIDLQTLADAFARWGCDAAINFDGGGSTTLVVKGEVVNTPSDPTGERPVSNALLIMQR